MKLWEIVKLATEKKLKEGDKFKALDLPFTMIIEYDGSDLVYNTNFGDITSKETVVLCSSEMNIEYEIIKKEGIKCEKSNIVQILKDPYMDEDKVLKRLKEEYFKYGKLIIAYDFDYTVNSYRGESWVYPEVIQLLKDWRDKAYFICYTSSSEERYSEIRNKIKELDIPLDYINENVKGVNVPQGCKLYYNILLDDRSGLGECVRVLKRLLKDLSYMYDYKGGSENMLNNEEIRKILICGLPDSRIYGVVRQLQVISDNGTEIELKNRSKKMKEEDSYVLIDRELEYKELNNLVKDLEQKNVKITSKVYRHSEAKELLKQI